MKRSRAWVRPAILAALLLALIWWLHLEHVDPRYNGRRTSEWLLALKSEDEQEVEQAELAIFVLGERAVPQITKFFYATEPEWQDDLYELIEDKTGWELKKVEAYDMQWMGESAVDILGKRAAPMIPRLIEAISDEDFDFASQQALLAIGEPAIKPLKAELGSQKPETQVAAIYLLAKLEQRDILPVLKQRLESDHAEVRAISFVALAKLGIPQEDLLTLVQRLLKDKEAVVRAEAVNMLGHLAETDHLLIPQFAAYHKDPAKEVRGRVAARIWRLCHLHDAAIDALQSGLEDADGSIKWISYFGLLVALGEIPKHPIGEERVISLWPIARLSFSPSEKPLVPSVEAVFRRGALLKPILSKQIDAVAQSGDSYRPYLSNMACGCYLVLCSVPKAARDEFFGIYRSSFRTYQPGNSIGLSGQQGGTNSRPKYYHPSLGHKLGKLGMTPDQWKRLQNVISQINQADMDAGNVALRWATNTFDLSTVTNTVTTP